jgi:hypothetical protein
MKHWLSYLQLPVVGNPAELQGEMKYMEREMTDMYAALRIKEREMLGLIAQIERAEQDLLKELPKRGLASVKISKAKANWMSDHGPVIKQLANNRPLAWPALLTRHCEWHSPTDTDNDGPPKASAS